MEDMNSITSEIKCLDAYVKAMKNSYTHSTLLEDLDNVLMHINNLKAWAGIDVEADENTLPIQRVSGSASFDTVKRIWNAAENYTMHELGEICKGDAAYCEDVPDLETYFDRHYR